MDTRAGMAKVLVTIFPSDKEPIDTWVRMPCAQLLDALKYSCYGDHAFGALKRTMCVRLGLNADECSIGIVDPSEAGGRRLDCRHVEVYLEGGLLLH